jgi:uncharacterized protein YggU (UPF0235/DUF167 family)
VTGFDAAGTLRLKVTAPPVDGEANDAVVALLARRLDVPRSRIRVARGASGRVKTIEVTGLGEADVRSRLAGGAS